jgi:arabinogalactan endo-1,4-beta-galactosidase
MIKKIENCRMAVLAGIAVMGLTISGCGSQDVALDVETGEGQEVTADVETGAGQEATTDTETNADKEVDTKADADNSTDVQTGLNTEDIFVEKIDGLSADFICGMDASSVLVEENSGVKYYDFQGQEADVFRTMAEAGVNCIRLRVWNDPYDEDGHGYGGGNNDVATAIELGKRATDAGMQVMIDFHYSDFWADPKKQFAPKAWADMGINDKCEALSSFTVDALGEILDAGVNVAFVQIGNEINNGMSGETALTNVTKLLNAGSKAVRAVAADKNKDIQIIVHYTNIEDNGGKVYKLVSNLESNAIDYDIIGLSYYPYWHDDIDNMKTVISNLLGTYDKKVMIVETAYPYTTSDGDGSGNSFDGKEGLVEGYSATVQGQAHMVRDIIAGANEAGAIGVCYWEGVWIPVGSDASSNALIWEEHGSGWASRYAKDYDPNDAGKYYGGCSWDNQAMFDFKGYPLASLNVFKYVYEGHATELKVESVPDLYVTCGIGEEVTLPEKAAVLYNDPSATDEIEIVWDEADLAKIDTSTEAKLNIHGTLQNEEKSRVICHLEVKLDNFVVNPSFEETDRSMWKVSSNAATDPTDYQDKKDDAYDGTVALHFWDGVKEIDFTVTQEITGLEPGIYSLECYAQGGDVNDTAEMELFCDTTAAGDEVTHYSEPFMVTSWAQWKNPVIPEIEVTGDSVIIGVHIKSNVKSWGTVDNFILKKMQ